jgi:ornithine carbamoyltransferase
VPVLRGRDFLRDDDFSGAELASVLDTADRLKRERRDGTAHRLLDGRAVGLVFAKPSTRTRTSFAAGLAQLGATAVPLATADLHLSRGESLGDTARVLSAYLDAIVVRTYAQAEVEELAAAASVPVVNGLTDDFHPCQALSDAMTIRERFGRVEGVRVAYVGDGNNMCNSLLLTCALLGAHVTVATPEGYEPDEDVVARARRAAALAGGSVALVRDPREAAAAAQVLYTDVWTSMGQEDEAERRRRDLAAYRIDAALVELADPDGVVLHCLPAHDGEEIDRDVLDGPRSAVWDQAENRLHAQKALLVHLIR